MGVDHSNCWLVLASDVDCAIALSIELVADFVNRSQEGGLALPTDDSAPFRVATLGRFLNQNLAMVDWNDLLGWDGPMSGQCDCSGVRLAPRQGFEPRILSRKD
jgi:hypothetical protein